MMFVNMSRRLMAGLLGLVPCVIAVPAARADWPEFRGPWGDGHASAPGDTKPIGLPLRWSETNNVKWKTPIPERGWSTPVVLSGQVWLTTATVDGHDFFAICVDADTGALLWKHEHGNKFDVHAVTPVYRNGCVYYTGGYNSGGGQLKFPFVHRMLVVGSGNLNGARFDVRERQVAPAPEFRRGRTGHTGDGRVAAILLDCDFFSLGFG